MHHVFYVPIPHWFGFGFGFASSDTLALHFMYIHMSFVLAAFWCYLLDG